MHGEGHELIVVPGQPLMMASYPRTQLAPLLSREQEIVAEGQTTTAALPQSTEKTERLATLAAGSPP